MLRRGPPYGRRVKPHLPPAADPTRDQQREVAEDTILDVDASGHRPGKTVTEQLTAICRFPA